MSFLRRSFLPVSSWWKCSQRLSNYSSSSVGRTNLNFKVNDKPLGYLVKKVENIDELNLLAVHLEHERTRAQHLHLACEDPNNFFGVMLLTAPTDSTGMPHILEHLALCGSEKYPCKDPFMNMLNRSLATFMNAFTSPDQTMYVFSSQNSKDFNNLMSVYLDAVFKPLLSSNDFRQEGWRLEHEDINNTESPIILKGVVFNEMKGVFSDPNQYYARHLMNLIFPDTTYSNESGGDPLQIPSLKWEDLKRFHSKYYHPSNARFITYGNLPLQDHLEKIETSILNNFDCLSESFTVPNAKKWSFPREATIFNRFDPMAAVPEKQVIVSNTYILENITDTYENFALSILGTLLVDGPNAPFYQNLLQSGIGPDYSPWTGYLSFFKQSAFSVGLREIHENDIDRVKDLIRSTFEEVEKTGFPEKQIQGVLHNVELSTKHQTSNFGLSCASGVSEVWNHGGDPIEAFKVNSHVQWFQQKMKENPRFLQDKIRQYFLENNHMLTLIMKPEEGFESKQIESEKELLNKKTAGLSSEDKQLIFNQGLELAEHQKKIDVSCLPTLLISDVEKSLVKTNLSFESIGNVPIQLCEQPTKGVVYFKGLIDASDISEEDFSLLPLLCSVATQMGTRGKNYKDLDSEIQLKTGGLNLSLHLSEHPSHLGQFKQDIYLHSYCLERNSVDMFYLWKDVLKNLCLEDSDRLSQLIRLQAAELAQGLSQHGHLYAMRKASSSLGLSAARKESAFGFSQTVFLKEMAEQIDHKNVQKRLTRLASDLFDQASLKCAVNATPGDMPSAVKNLEHFLSGTGFSQMSQHEMVSMPNFTPSSKSTHIVLPLSVNHLGQCIPTVPYTHKDFPSLQVAAKLLSSKFLHTEIREKGGAYGGRAKLDKSGIFTMFSYRDPNTSRTLDNFKLGIDWLLNSDHSQQHIDEAKLGVFGEVDAPVTPGTRGSLFFLEDISYEMKESFRQGVFQCTKDDIVSVTQKYLKNSSLSGVTLIGAENELSKKDNKWTIISSKL